MVTWREVGVQGNRGVVVGPMIRLLLTSGRIYVYTVLVRWHAQGS